MSGTIRDTTIGATFDSRVRAAQFAEEYHNMTLEEALRDGPYTRDHDNDQPEGEWVKK